MRSSPTKRCYFLVGPGGKEVNAVGLTWTTTTGYDSGPTLVGAKLNRAGDRVEGEGGVQAVDRFGYLPNDEFALYGQADFRLRVLTTGGFSPDGLIGLRPHMFEDFFRLHAKGPRGDAIMLDKVGSTTRLLGGALGILGLFDLGKAENPKAASTTTTCSPRWDSACAWLVWLPSAFL